MNLARNLEAVQSLEQATALDPQHADAFYHLGITRMRINDYQKAINSFDRVLEINPYYDGVKLQREKALSSLNPLER